MRDRAAHAGATKKGGNVLYGLRFARTVALVWRRDHRFSAHLSRHQSPDQAFDLQ
jgi:hypothetical protein